MRQEASVKSPTTIRFCWCCLRVPYAIRVAHMGSWTVTTRTGGAEAKGETRFFNRTLSKALIQEIPTGRYYRGPSVWTADEGRAFDFRTGSAARECATKLNLSNVQVVMRQELREWYIFVLKSSFRP